MVVADESSTKGEINWLYFFSLSFSAASRSSRLPALRTAPRWIHSIAHRHHPIASVTTTLYAGFYYFLQLLLLIIYAATTTIDVAHAFDRVATESGGVLAGPFAHRETTTHQGLIVKWPGGGGEVRLIGPPSSGNDASNKCVSVHSNHWEEARRSRPMATCDLTRVWRRQWGYYRHAENIQQEARDKEKYMVAVLVRWINASSSTTAATLKNSGGGIAKVKATQYELLLFEVTKEGVCREELVKRMVVKRDRPRWESDGEEDDGGDDGRSRHHFAILENSDASSPPSVFELRELSRENLKFLYAAEFTPPEEYLVRGPFLFPCPASEDATLASLAEWYEPEGDPPEGHTLRGGGQLACPIPASHHTRLHLHFPEIRRSGSWLPLPSWLLPGGGKPLAAEECALVGWSEDGSGKLEIESMECLAARRSFGERADDLVVAGKKGVVLVWKSQYGGEDTKGKGKMKATSPEAERREPGKLGAKGDLVVLATHAQLHPSEPAWLGGLFADAAEDEGGGGKNTEHDSVVAASSHIYVRTAMHGFEFRLLEPGGWFGWQSKLMNTSHLGESSRYFSNYSANNNNVN